MSPVGYGEGLHHRKYDCRLKQIEELVGLLFVLPL